LEPTVEALPVPASLQAAVWRKFQRAIWRRGGGTCRIRGGAVPLVDMEIDHVVPIAQGGSHALDNLQPAHDVCNQRTGAGRWPSSAGVAARAKPQSSPRAHLTIPAELEAAEDTLTVAQIAARLRFSEDTVRRYVRAGRLRRVAGRRGRGHRIAVSEFINFVEVPRGGPDPVIVTDELDELDEDATTEDLWLSDG
jgi:excisionase family DNA binding protein